MSGVWVYVENRGGDIPAASQEAIGAARTVAAALGQSVTALVFGAGAADAAAAAFNLGADAVLGSTDDTLTGARIEAVGPLCSSLAAERQPAVIIIGGSTRGRDLAAWLGADLDAGVVTDAISLNVADGVVQASRPVYAGKLMADVFVPSGVQIVTLRSRAFAKAEPTGGAGSAEWVSAVVAEEAIPTKVVGYEGKSGGVSLTDASIIVSGGRGVGGPDGFAPVQELANALNGALGASRAAVDAGWIAYEHQVGQTGKTVSPDLYIACGISGAIQHQAGMRTSKIIVAINKDGDAPIFKLAQYGIVGDLFKVLPALTAEFNKRLS
jgi:electron transfer flavoprotein alpha subunit